MRGWAFAARFGMAIKTFRKRNLWCWSVRRMWTTMYDLVWCAVAAVWPATAWRFLSGVRLRHLCWPRSVLDQHRLVTKFNWPDGRPWAAAVEINRDRLNATQYLMLIKSTRSVSTFRSENLFKISSTKSVMFFDLLRPLEVLYLFQPINACTISVLETGMHY